MGEIRLHEVTKVYGGVPALDGFTLDIADGELVAVIGPPGAGKTTLLRLIAGLEAPTHGDIAIAGRLMARIEPARRGVAMVFQGQALYPHMTVFANMAFALVSQGMRRTEIAERVTATAELLGLADILQRHPGDLTAGECRRVAVGRAVVRAPQAFLFDEPLAGLDAATAERLRIEIAGLQREIATTTLHVTGDQAEAMSLASRIVVLNAGRVEQVGAPLDLYERPATAFVAGFIGAPAMNLVPVEVGAMTGALHLAREASIPGAFGALASHGEGRVTLGIRPEHIARAGARATDGLRGEVTAVERLGAESIVRVRVASAVVLTMRLIGTSALSPGDITTLSIDPAAFHFFDSKTGARIAFSPPG